MSSNKKKNKMERGLTNRHVQVMAIAGNNRNWTFPRCWSLYQPYRTFHHPDLHDHRAFMFFDDEGCWGDAVSGSRTTYLYQLYHPSFGERLGIFLSLVYWLSVVFIGMAEITAISDYVRFWFPPGLAGWFNLSFNDFGFGQSDCG